MDFLNHNALADMPGPAFLGLYFVFGALVILIVNAWVRWGSRDAGPPPLVPTRPDPYEIAFLRDGVTGVIWVAVYALKRAGLIELTDKGRFAPTDAMTPTADPLEARVLRAIGAGVESKDLVRDGALRADIANLCEPRRRHLLGQGLLNTGAARVRANLLATLGALGLIALAFYKMEIALAHGHRNVGFLIAEAAAAVFILFFSVNTAVLSSASRRGRAFLTQMKTAYQDRGSSPLGDAAALAMVGVFGYEILRGGPDAALAEHVKSLSRSDGGSSCSSSSCSSGDGGGGGCGGCGGGD